MTFSRSRALAIVLAIVVMLVPAVAGAEGRDAPLTRIAFGSCLHQDKPAPILDAVLGWRPELFIFAGDNVYGDVTSSAMLELEAAYARAGTNPRLTRLRAEVPVLATWDDHDLGRNDGGGDFPWRERSQRLFLDFWRVPASDPRRRRDGVYGSFLLGPESRRVQVILLDTRSFRSPLRPAAAGDATLRGPWRPDPDPAARMLGEAQWRWLEEALLQPAAIRLIVSSVQVLAEGHGFERWGNFPNERRRLLDLIARTGAGGVILLSGDRHMGALYRLAQDVAYPLHEITSSGLNMTWSQAHELGPHQLGPVWGAANFGTIEIDWWAGRLRLALRTVNGDVVREHALPLVALHP